MIKMIKIIIIKIIINNYRLEIINFVSILLR